MKKNLIAASVIAAGLALSACNSDKKKEATAEQPAAAPQAAAASALDSDIQKVSYGIGLNIAQNFKQQGIELDQSAFLAGVDDGLKGAEPKLKQEVIMAAMQAFQKAQMEKQMAERQAAENGNKAASEKFLAENAAKEGVVTTESGLQYKVITKGSETKKPGATDQVTVHYRGTLINGEEFDSSYSRNQPATFGVGNVIPGWTEALQLMSPGDKFELYIPSELGYGTGGAGAKIGPNQALIFEVELLEIVDPNAAAAAPAEG